MIECPTCGSTKKKSNGGDYLLSNGQMKKRFKCTDCQTAYTVNAAVEASPKKVSTESSPKTLVLVSANNNTDVNDDFFEVLLHYCELNDADLLVLPVRHKNPDEDFVDDYPEILTPYLLHETVEYPAYGLKVFGGLKLSASLENPLAGLDPIAKGFSMVIGHPQVQLKTLPRVHEEYPAIVSTTGSISVKNYRDTKSGTKAGFNHSASALVVEFDSVGAEKFVHMRHLNFDQATKSFYDIDTKYDLNGYEMAHASALITGDEHAMFTDPGVKKATYTDKHSLVNVTRPRVIVRHDIFDAHSISHHHRGDVFKRYEKYVQDTCQVETELELTIDFLNETTPPWAETKIVQSNHNEHLMRWLNECDPKQEPWNALIYHRLMYLELKSIAEGNGPLDPFQLYSEEYLNSNITFVGRNEKFEIAGIMLGSHGDVGTNGARGSRKQFSILPTKSVIGHSHSPGIEKGCYQVGTSSIFRLDYNVGASSWHHTHCLVHPNGKRQLIFIQHEKYRK